MSRKVFFEGDTGWQRSRESCSLSPVILHLCLLSSMKVLRDLGSTEMEHVYSYNRLSCLTGTTCGMTVGAAGHGDTLKRTLVSDRDN